MDFLQKFDSLNDSDNQQAQSLENWLKSYVYSVIRRQRPFLSFKVVSDNLPGILVPLIEAVEKLGRMLYAQNSNYLYDGNHRGIRMLYKLAELIEESCYFRCFLYQSSEDIYQFIRNYRDKNHVSPVFYLRASHKELYYFDGDAKIEFDTDIEKI